MSNEARDQRVGEVLRAFVSGPVADRLAEDALVEDRRTVTAVFADLSGFTALAGSLDPTELALVIDPVIAGLTRIVDRYGGAVEKFAGDAILAFFGAPIAHEDDPERALMAALDMHEQLPLLSSHPAAATLDLHIGINTGDVYARMVGSEARLDYAVLGEAVVLAQRLESMAPTGQTYVGAETARAVREGFVFEKLGALTVKGRAEPVPAMRLLGRAATSRDARRSQGGIVGRESEQAVLSGLLEPASAARLVVLVGDAGGGKSTLADWLAAEATDTGWGLIRLSALSYGVTTPYLPLVRALEHSSSEEPLNDPVLARLAGTGSGGDDPFAGSSPEAVLQSIRRSLSGWVSAQRGDRGVLIVAEDLHWIDGATLDLLVQLVRVGDPSIRVLATARPDTEGIDTLVTASGGLGIRRDLEPFGPAEVRALLEADLGAPPDDRVVALVQARSDGNPLFAVELGSLLADNGTLIERDGRWRLAEGVDSTDLPSTVGLLFGARVDALPPLLAETLWAAAVVGASPSVAVLHRMLGLSDQMCAERLARLAMLRLLTGGGGVHRFRHALLRDAVQDRLAPARARDLHLLAAEATAQALPPGAETSAAVGQHLFAGGALRLALPYLVTSGAAAREVHAHREAVEVLAHAVEAAAVDVVDPRLSMLLCDLADSQEAMGDYAAADSSFAHAVEVALGDGDSELAVVAWSRQGAVRRRTGVYPDALDILEVALSHPAAEEVDRRGLLLEKARTLQLLGRVGDARETVDAALEPSRSDAMHGRLLTERGSLHARAGGLADAAHDLDAALAMLAESADASGVVAALTFRGEVFERGGDIVAAQDVYRRAQAEALRLGRVEQVATILINRGFLALSVEDWAEAAEVFGAAAEEFAQVGHRPGVATSQSNQAFALAQMGELERAGALAESAVTEAEQQGRVAVAADAKTTRGLIAKLVGDLPLARRWAADAVQTAEVSGDPDVEAAARTLASELEAMPANGQSIDQ